MAWGASVKMRVFHALLLLHPAIRTLSRSSPLPPLDLLDALVSLLSPRSQLGLSLGLSSLLGLLLWLLVSGLLRGFGAEPAGEEHREDGADGRECLPCSESGNLRLEADQKASARTYQEQEPPDPVTQNRAAKGTDPSHVDSSDQSPVHDHTYQATHTSQASSTIPLPLRSSPARTPRLSRRGVAMVLNHR